MSVTDLTQISGRSHRTPTDSLDAGIKTWGYGIVENKEPGTERIDKFGRNPATTAGEAIQDEGGVISINTTASTVEIIGANGGDTFAGAGAKQVTIYGVDINWNPLTETINTNGLSASLDSDNEYLYVYRAKTVGSGAVRNLGDLTIRRSGAGAILSIITQGYGQTERAVMPVFAGCNLMVNKFRFEGSKTGILAGEIALMEYSEGEGIHVVHPFTFSSGNALDPITWDEAPKCFSEKTLVWIEALSISAGAIVTASFDGVMKRYKDSTP